MKIEKNKPFIGQHCETTATGTLLRQLDIELSEPMLFGLGEGLSFIYWKMKMFNFPFIGGRIKPDALTKTLSSNLNLDLEVKETSSSKKAWDEVRKLLDNGSVVGLKLDCYHLEYFSKPIHFAGHYVAIYGYDHEFAYLIDTQPQGGRVKTSLKSLALARSEKGAMASKNLYYTLTKKDGSFDLKKSVINALVNNAKEYLNPPITNISYKGILKTSSEIIKCFEQSKDVESDFKTMAMLMEKAGTGGGLFRNLYRDFLKESYDLLQDDLIKTAYEIFDGVSKNWTEVAHLFDEAGTTKNIKYINRASTILKSIAAQEKLVMESLLKIKT